MVEGEGLYFFNQIAAVQIYVTVRTFDDVIQEVPDQRFRVAAVRGAGTNAVRIFPIPGADKGDALMKSWKVDNRDHIDLAGNHLR